MTLLAVELYEGKFIDHASSVFILKNNVSSVEDAREEVESFAKVSKCLMRMNNHKRITYSINEYETTYGRTGFKLTYKSEGKYMFEYRIECNDF